MYETPTGGIRLPEPPSAARKVAMGARHHFSGTLVFGDGAGRAMDVESHTELQVALVMLARREVVDLEAQVPFAWIDPEGVRRTHVFDFRVTRRDATRVALIVKSAKQARAPTTRATAARIAAQVTPDVADEVRVITERDFDPVEVHNARLLHSVREADPPADAAAARLVAATAGAVRIGDLVERLGLGGRGFRAVVRLLRRHALDPVRHERITPDTLVRRRTA